jgi:hypothetical protein
VIRRVQADEAFAKALLDEAATLFRNGEPETAQLILRDLVNATIGFEQLATLTAKPSMDNLAASFRAVGKRLHVNVTAH